MRQSCPLPSNGVQETNSELKVRVILFLATANVCFVQIEWRIIRKILCMKDATDRSFRCRVPYGRENGGKRTGFDGFEYSWG